MGKRGYPPAGSSADTRHLACSHRSTSKLDLDQRQRHNSNNLIPLNSVQARVSIRLGVNQVCTVEENIGLEISHLESGESRRIRQTASQLRTGIRHEIDSNQDRQCFRPK